MNVNDAAFALRVGSTTTKTKSTSAITTQLKLKRNSGKVAFQLYSKSVPAMKASLRMLGEKDADANADVDISDATHPIEEVQNHRRLDDVTSAHDSTKEVAEEKTDVAGDTAVNSGTDNTTAIRTDWETTTGKAVNYSFYMMTICLTQIVLLLRQFLHTQVHSAATRVSQLCIGWQTVINALLYLVHIYLSLAMQPPFTAFASVAFFKLLIFCVIEVKYMAIIIQARNASNGGNSIELLRRQVAMLHLRFYVALMGSQIVHNVATEAKKPLHLYYVYGMSITRLVAPLYMFAVQGHFLKEVYPESPTNVFMCQLLVLWVGFQAGILGGQSRYGARFFIPAQFLPPKYDYNRPIPASLLPSDDEIANSSEQLQKERELLKTEVRSFVVPKRDVSPRGGGARIRKEGNRMKGEPV